jgi:hypothetical protein
MPDASNSLPKRKRGGQPGNSNRRIHGLYTKKEAARREELRGFRRKGRALVILVDNILKARLALKRRLAARALIAAAACARRLPSRRSQTVSRKPCERTQGDKRTLRRTFARSPPAAALFENLDRLMERRRRHAAPRA